MPKIIHYRQKCIGCGICYELQPDLWRMSKKDGKATLIRATAKKGLYILSASAPLRNSRYVAGACPAKVIQVVS